MHGHPVDADALLAHGEFVRALARRLVFDDDRVDDVVQETWLAALEHAPERPRSLKAWLARVARNVAIKALRGESRRRRREEGAPEPRPPEPPPDAVDRLARGRHVVDAVLALDEPYRTTVVLRFYEDLEPKEIGRRLGIPGATVRTRLKRGLDMLRARLDRDAGGRRAWCLALLPVLVPHGKPVTGGILLMSAKSKLSITAVLLLAAAVGLSATWGAGGSGRGAERASPAQSAPAGARSEGASGTATVPESPAGAIRVVVRVEDEAGRPLAGALVEAHRAFVPEVGIGYSSEDSYYAGATQSPPVASATTDATGIAVFRHDPGLALAYRATRQGYAQEEGGLVVLRPGVEPDPLTLRLGPAYPLSGVVLDEEGEPVAGAPVLAADPAWGAVPWDVRIPWRTASGPDGAYGFDDLPPRDVAVWAALPGGVPLRVAILRFPHVGKFDITLERGGVVTGTVTEAATGEPIPGVRVRAVAGITDHRAEACTDALGRYEIRTLPACYLSTIRFRKDGYCQVFDGDGNGAIGLHLGLGDVLRVDGRMRPAPVVRGTVHGPEGPLSGVPVQFSCRQPRYGTLFQTRTDDSGRYSLAVAPGRFVATIGVRDLRIAGALDPYVHPDKATGEEANVVDVPEEGEVVRDFRLEAMPEFVAVSGRVVDREGQPVGGARIGPWGEVNAADGSFKTRAWPGHPVWARKPGYGLGMSGPVEAGHDVEIVLVPAPLLSGSVVLPGDVADGAFVLVAPDPDPNRTGEQRIAVSGGRYEIRDLDPGAYVVRAGATRCAISAPRRVVLEAAGEHVLDFVLDAGEAIRGRVVEAERHSPVRGAWVRVQLVRPAAPEDQRDPAAKTGVVVAVSDAKGEFVVENLVRGEYEVGVEARGFAKWSSRASTGGAPADAALERILKIRGVVTFSDGQPGAGLSVFARPEDGTKSQLFARGTSPEGRFVIRDLARGAYRVTAGGRGARTLTSPPVEAGTADLRLVVERAGPGESEDSPQALEGDATLEGRIVDPSGKGIVGVRVHAAPMTTKLLGRTTRSGPDGRFVFRGLTEEPHRVRAVFDGEAAANGTKQDGSLYQTLEDVTPGRDTPSFVFATLSGTIVGEDLDGRQLVARARDAKDGGWRSVVVGRDGAFRIEGLSPGRYDLAFNSVKERPHLLVEGGDGVEAGRKDVVLRATKGASIAGIVVDESGKPVANAHVGAASEGSRGGPWMKTREDGGFDLTGLRGGVEYLVGASFADWVPAETRVRAPASDLRIVVERGFEVSGRLLDADGKPLVNAQIRFVPVGHDAPERSAQVDSEGRFTVTGLRDGDYRAEMWPRVAPAGGDAQVWQAVGVIRARDKDVEIRMK